MSDIRQDPEIIAAYIAMGGTNLSYSEPQEGKCQQVAAIRMSIGDLAWWMQKRCCQEYRPIGDALASKWKEDAKDFFFTDWLIEEMTPEDLIRAASRAWGFLIMTKWKITYGYCDGTGPYTKEVEAYAMLDAIKQVSTKDNYYNMVSCVLVDEPKPGARKGDMIYCRIVPPP